MLEHRPFAKASPFERTATWLFRTAFLLVLLFVGIWIGGEYVEPKLIFADENERIEALQALGGSPELRVIALVTDWCPACKSLESSFRKEGIRFLRIDIEKNGAGAQLFERCAALDGSRGIPKVIVDRDLVGYSFHAVKERLGGRSASPQP